MHSEATSRPQSRMGIVARWMLAVVLVSLPATTAWAASLTGQTAGVVNFVRSGFNPLTARIYTGETLSFRNAGDKVLQLTTAPTAPRHLSATVEAGASTALTFSQPGVYVLYDAATTGFGTKTFGHTHVNQVIARSDSPYYPMPAYAIVVVEDRDGGGIPTTSPSVTIPDSSMTFVPWVTVVHAGTKVTFTNEDSDTHMVTPPAEPMLMPQSGHSTLKLERMLTFQPIILTGNGGTGSLTLNPGVYHYYCAIHATYSSESHTYVPYKSFGGYPYVQDGVIVVLPR